MVTSSIFYSLIHGEKSVAQVIGAALFIGGESRSRLRHCKLIDW